MENLLLKFMLFFVQVPGESLFCYRLRRNLSILHFIDHDFFFFFLLQSYIRIKFAVLISYEILFPIESLDHNSLTQSYLSPFEVAGQIVQISFHLGF